MICPNSQEWLIYNNWRPTMWPVMCTVPTCWERESGKVGIATETPGVAPPKEKVMLWEALSVVCGLVNWWLTPPIRSKSSAEGGTAVGLEAEGDWTPPKRSVTGWEGAELDVAGGLAEKAFQSPNSPFPLDDAAAGHKSAVIMLNCGSNIHLDFKLPFFFTVCYIHFVKKTNKKKKTVTSSELVLRAYFSTYGCCHT